MRARLPDEQGHVDHGGLAIGYEVFGDGAPAILLLPTWTIIHSRFWKLQVPHLARRHRVITFDGPGNGRSARPLDPAAYTVDAVAGAAVAVLDATGTDRAVLVSLSKGARWSLKVASDHPERVLGQVLIAPSLDLAAASEERAAAADRFFAEIEDPQGWDRYNAHHWLAHHADFAKFFFAECFSEPHSTKPREDTVGWALESVPEVLVADAIAEKAGPDRATLLDWCARVDSPVLVLHGTDDRVSPPARAVALADATDGELVLLEGCGHIPLARDPVQVNRLISTFVERLP
jgi:pimeloyl-ACP methyl ester carboxylesterase